MLNPIAEARLRAKEWLANKITSSETMAVRDRLLDNDYFNNKAPHAKRFIQYLTGGVKGDVIRELPPELKQKVVEAYKSNINWPDASNFPERRTEDWGEVIDKNKNNPYPFYNPETGEDLHAVGKGATTTYWDTDMPMNERKVVIKYNFPIEANPSSNRLSTYPQANPWNNYQADERLQNQVGDIDSFEPDGKGGYFLRDLWTVTPERDDTFLDIHDLQEGGWPAALLYRGAEALGTNKPFRYEVPFSAEEMQQW